MATKFKAGDVSIVIDKTFVSGKDRVTIDGQVVFEGKLVGDTPHEFPAGKGTISLRARVVSKFTSATVFDVEVREQGQTIFSGKYDQMGQPVFGDKEAGQNQIQQICSTIGGVIGAALCIGLVSASGIFPRGIIGSAIAGGIGGGLGGALGYGIAKLMNQSK